jgi:hypothetical protein
MKKSGAAPALLTPDAIAWRLLRAGVPPQKFATLAEAAAALPAGTLVHLALPCQAVLLERMTLPATDRAELAGMVQLQLEKSLPFAIEDVAADFQIVETGGTESTLVSAAAQNVQLDALCAPLRERGRPPEKITPFAMHIAAACPADETVLAVYPEQGQLVVAICEKGRLAWTQVIPSVDADSLRDALPQLMLSAEMEGAPAVFARVRLAEECVQLTGPLREFFQIPVETVSFDGDLPEPAINLVPASWQADVERGARAASWRNRIIGIAVLWLLAIAGAFAYLAWLKAEAGTVTAKYRAAQPAVQAMETRRTRWRTIEPAIDPQRYVVEVLFQAARNLPSNEIRITEFDVSGAQWRVVGEAPSAAVAIDYMAKLRAEKGLEAFTIDAKPPQLLPNEHAQFNINGKLKP